MRTQNRALAHKKLVQLELALCSTAWSLESQGRLLIRHACMSCQNAVSLTHSLMSLPDGQDCHGRLASSESHSTKLCLLLIISAEQVHCASPALLSHIVLQQGCIATSVQQEDASSLFSENVSICKTQCMCSQLKEVSSPWS